ncbi:MAG TPA: C-factor [Pelagibacterium sp.]|uniref:SDR family NAD(P)-dependent oxidoreductase n=1 Tax=uncultured Pelagibacterium sp. TaxID=1159875 RepID=UPI000C4F4807|nr:C-factor [Pelagibacterium sp.]HCO56278.1 C-factor [Pelagibacterium sp.]|tara:strand:- start:12809 stop:13501 length:693 start_codon:yes stop_codon:yes gene_type:complete
MTEATQALIIGSTGGIGRALVEQVRASGRYDLVTGLSRSSSPAIDITDEASIVSAMDAVAGRGVLRLVILATGFLHHGAIGPEKANRHLSGEALAQAFAVNTIGPALVLKHVLPLLPRSGRSVVMALSARVGSISDNRLGGWHSYRASKAALNQIVRTCAIELARTHRDAVLVAMHPGTVDTPLSRPFSRSGLDVQQPEDAAGAILAGLDTLTPSESGQFFDRTGERLPY